MTCSGGDQDTEQAAAGLKPPPGLETWCERGDAAPGGVLKLRKTRRDKNSSQLY